MNKPIEVIKKLKNHFYKLSKKNKSDATNAALPIVRNSDTTSNTTDSSSTVANGPHSKARRSLESVNNVEPAQQTIINRNVERAQSSVTGKQISDVDLFQIFPSKDLNHSQSTKVIRSDRVESQTSNTSWSTIDDISRNSDIPRVADAFHVKIYHKKWRCNKMKKQFR